VGEQQRKSLGEESFLVVLSHCQYDSYSQR
jgi:hypothetical protein